MKSVTGLSCNVVYTDACFHIFSISIIWKLRIYHLFGTWLGKQYRLVIEMLSICVCVCMCARAPFIFSFLALINEVKCEVSLLTFLTSALAGVLLTLKPLSREHESPRALGMCRQRRKALPALGVRSHSSSPQPIATKSHP